MVKAFHAAGIEVILDVVYNHTAEGNQLGPLLSLKGFDNPAYYRLDPDDRRHYVDFTGTGNSLNMRHSQTLQLMMDSLRYWILEMHVDGFRFDLAATLARGLHEVDRLSSFFDLIHQDPVVNRVKLIAEPWDVGEGGYQVGNFPPLWSEWNGKYRDGVRDYWRGADETLADFAIAVHRQLRSVRLVGPDALGQHQLRHRPRRVHAGRPGLLRPQAQRGQRRGQPRRRVATTGRGTPGVEGPTDDPDDPRCAQTPAALDARDPVALPGRPHAVGRRRDRPHPGRQQQRLRPGQRGLLVRLGPTSTTSCSAFVRRLIAHPCRPTPSSGAGAGSRAARSTAPASATSAGTAPTDAEMTDDDWEVGYARSLAVFLNGDAITAPGPRGERIVDDSFLDAASTPTPIR